MAKMTRREAASLAQMSDELIASTLVAIETLPEYRVKASGYLKLKAAAKHDKLIAEQMRRRDKADAGFVIMARAMHGADLPAVIAELKNEFIRTGSAIILDAREKAEAELAAMQVIEFMPEVNSAASHVTFYHAGRPAGSMSRKRATDRGNGPVWTICDREGRTVETVNIGGRRGELLAMQRAARYLQRTFGPANVLHPSIVAELRADTAARVAERDALEVQAKPGEMIDDRSQTLDADKLASDLSALGMTVMTFDETGGPFPLETENQAPEMADPDAPFSALRLQSPDTVDRMQLEPTWRGLLPLYVQAASEGEVSAKRELQRMAEFADLYVAQTREALTAPDGWTIAEGEGDTVGKGWYAWRPDGSILNCCYASRGHALDAANREAGQ